MSSDNDVPNVDAPAPDSAATLSYPIRLSLKISCHTCGAVPSEGKSLQKCGGCNVALYCNRDCQKAAWKSHRLICRQSSTDTAAHGASEDAGRTSGSPDASEIPLVGLASFTRFRTMHSWTMDTMCQASLLLREGGRGAESMRRKPVVMYFHVVPSKAPRAKPWNAWILKVWRFRSLSDCLEEDPSLAKVWEERKVEFREQEAEDRAKFGSRLAGELPVLFHVEGTHNTLITHQPILKLRDPDALQDPEARGALEDLIALCVGYTNMGIPLGRLEGCEMVAFPGRVFRVKEKKAWAWIHRGTLEQPWDDLWIEIFRHVGRKTDLPPMDLMLLFWNLTAEEACPGLVLCPPDSSLESMDRILPTQHTRIR